jgi:hypothetical protein
MLAAKVVTMTQLRWSSQLHASPGAGHKHRGSTESNWLHRRRGSVCLHQVMILQQ